MKRNRRSETGTTMLVAYATMWVAVAVAVIAGMLITKSAWCLWAFLLPANIDMKVKSSSESDDENDDKERLEDDLK